MSTLTYASRHMAAAEAAEARPVRKPFWARLYAAIVESRQRRAERDIGRFLASRAPLNDQLEREIMRRLSGAGLS